MTRRAFLSGLTATSAMAAAPAMCFAHGYKRGAIEIVHPWCLDRFAEGTRDAVVGMDIKCTTARGDKLLRAESKLAASIEVRDQGGAQVPFLVIPGMSRTTLGRNSPHLRLISLKKALVAYDTIPVSLVFERSGRIVVDVLVEETVEEKT